MKKQVARNFFLYLVAVVSLAFLGLIAEFLLATFWAVILAILFNRRYEKIQSKMPEKTDQAAALTVSYALLIFIVPLLVISVAVVFQAGQINEKLKEKENDSIEEVFEETVEDLQEQIPVDKKTLKKYGLSTKKLKKKFNNFLEDSTQSFAGYAIGFTQNMFTLMVNFFLMLYIFFFFLRDGPQLIKELIWVVPMKDKDEKELFQRFESVARATVKGSLVVAFVQGVIGGLLFFLLGIEASFLWGLIMIVASLLPVGSALVWGPWAIILLAQGDYTRGCILIVVGVGFIGLIDNFLRPRLVGKDTKMPDYLILLSTLGGLTWFGLSGFVIGPVIAALFVTCWQMMGKEYGRARNENEAKS